MHIFNACIISTRTAHQMDPEVSGLAVAAAAAVVTAVLEPVRHIHLDLLDIAGLRPAAQSYNLAELEADPEVVGAAASLAAAAGNQYSDEQIEDFGAVELEADTVAAGRMGWKTVRQSNEVDS
jgi:hypothetical protein